MYRLIILLFIPVLLLSGCTERGDIEKNTPIIQSEKETIIPPEVTKETLSMGVVELSVRDMDTMIVFYRDQVGFDLISTGDRTANLGDNNEIFLRLIEEKNFVSPLKGEAGLYHTAITHNSRRDLAERILRITTTAPGRYQGSADHTATEAFYFSDPEGNGLELYYDKPRTDWTYVDDKPVMGNAYLDMNTYIQKYASTPVSGGQTRMGHVHLKIGNIDIAKDFYEKVLQFEEMSKRNDALFVSRDKYHHHLGMNTWESLNAGKRTKNTYGLRSFEIIYHDQALYTEIITSLKDNGYPLIYSNDSVVTEDPWGNVIIIKQK